MYIIAINFTPKYEWSQVLPLSTIHHWIHLGIYHWIHLDANALGIVELYPVGSQNKIADQIRYILRSYFLFDRQLSRDYLYQGNNLTRYGFLEYWVLQLLILRNRDKNSYKFLTRNIAG